MSVLSSIYNRLKVKQYVGGAFADATGETGTGGRTGLHIAPATGFGRQSAATSMPVTISDEGFSEMQDARLAAEGLVAARGSSLDPTRPYLRVRGVPRRAFLSSGAPGISAGMTVKGGHGRQASAAPPSRPEPSSPAPTRASTRRRAGYTASSMDQTLRRSRSSPARPSSR